MFSLENKVAFVTGASSGIGRATAFSLASQGAKVAVAARRLDRLQTLVAEIKNRGKDALAIQMDVTKKEDIDHAIEETVKTFGKLDILVNNAGALDYTPFLEITEEKWDKIIDTNLKGYFLVAKRAAKEMVKNNPPTGGGRIVQIASISSGGVGIGFPLLTHYTASKGGVIGLTEAMAIELGPLGITVNAIAPGAILSEMSPNEDVSAYANRMAIKRIGKPEEIAAAVVYLVSDEAAYTTGATLNVDGGWLAG